MAADRLGTSRQAIQRIANDLVTDGLAVLADNPRHRRSPFLTLTPEGRRVLSAISEQARRRHSALLSRLNHLDLAATRSALRELTSVVRSAVERGGAADQ
jgi:DNA-binding MarR family transcriptional regulator